MSWLSRAVFASEIKQLLRDRRALFMAVVLPMGLFPFLLFGMDSLEESARRTMREQPVSVVADLRGLGADLAGKVRAKLADPALRIELEPVEVDPVALSEDADWRAAASRIIGERQVLLVGTAGSDGMPEIAAYYDGSASRSNEAGKRVREALRDLDRELRAAKLVDIAGADPARALELESRDVARAEDTVGRKLGQLLPIVLVLMLISGGSFAALGVFAGEREAGTIETLLVQPVPPMALALGKFLAVLTTACASLFGNAASFLFCVAMGWGDLPEAAAQQALGTNGGRLFLGLLFFLPTAILLAAVLCLVSARAKSFREGQHYVFPLVLLASALAVLSTMDRVEASWPLALVPVTGATLVLRDTLAGSFPLVPGLLSLVATALWSWLALSRLAVTLDAERIFRGRDDQGELARRHASSRRALAWGVAAVALVYVVGGRMQSASAIPGLVLTLWVLVPALALLCARGVARRSGESLARVLGLRAPRPLHLLAALLLAPGLAWGMKALFELQQHVLPMPREMQDLELFPGLADLSPWALVLLLAVSPGLNEELLFRGAILSGLRRDLSLVKVVLWEALLFGAVHASIYRFLPTALLGAVLAAVTLRTRSIFPAMAIHVTYNTLLVLEVRDLPAWGLPLAVGSSLLLLFVRKPSLR